MPTKSVQVSPWIDERKRRRKRRQKRKATALKLQVFARRGGGDVDSVWISADIRVVRDRETV